MQKDFDGWNQQKKQTHERSHAPYAHERELWWCAVGVNIGFEQDGSGEEYRRPVLIIRGISRNTCIVVPLTASPQSHPLRISLGIVDGKEARAIISQLRVIDTKRLVRKIGRLDKTHFSTVKKAVKGNL